MIQDISLKVISKKADWYALVTRPRAEKKVAERISSQWHTFLPLQTQWRLWSDRKKKVQLPLIPSFIFVKTTEKELSTIVKEVGIVRVLCYLGKPAIVREEEIETLKLLINNTDEVRTINPIDLSNGEIIEITQGPFAGLTASYISHQGKYKVIINLETTSTYFQVEVAANSIKKISVSV
jgi:transcription antitermination factor NusG